MNDQSPMPFGKYKGAKLEDVPAAYLLWLWDEGIHAEKNRDLHHYIKECFTALTDDAPDYIVKHHP